MLDASLVLLLAFLLDLLLGDPAYRLHPVRLIGRLVSISEAWTRKIGWDTRSGGALLLLISQGAILAILLGLSSILEALHPLLAKGFAVFVCYSLIALKDLVDHIRPALAALRGGDLEAARKGISMVVGRDAGRLERPGICRAAIETLGENFVDGFWSPVFWYSVGALLAPALGLNPVTLALGLMAVFKVTSTIDSMLGYKHEPYRRLGWAGARMDDLLNFPPARLSVLPLSIGVVATGADLGSGIRTFLRDRLKHDSPNAAHAESLVSGALRVRLGGPTRYPGGMKNKPWLGAEFRDPELHDIERTFSIVRASAWAAILLSCAWILVARMVW
ncbi:MAG: cobalamin biosynthesis protein CobD [Deltaproteobacteria bacterium]|nr:cobalamin biosynthesis protein CobD [Deltaproteobacteria bacterium]